MSDLEPTSPHKLLDCLFAELMSMAFHWSVSWWSVNECSNGPPATAGRWAGFYWCCICLVVHCTSCTFCANTTLHVWADILAEAAVCYGL